MLGTDSEDLTTFTTELDRHENEIVFGDKNVRGGWIKVCDKTFTVEEPGIYYIGLYGYTKEGSYFSLRLDDLCITPVTDGIGSVKAKTAGLTWHDGVVEVSDAKEIKSWTVFNAQGQLVMQGTGNGTDRVQIGLAALNSGLYLVGVKTADGAVQTLKLKK